MNGIGIIQQQYKNPKIINDLSKAQKINIEGEELEFTNGFTDLHTLSYQHILNGNGFGLEQARPSIDVVYKIRTMDISNEAKECRHPFLK